MTYSDSVSETSSVWSSDSDQEQTSKYTLGFCDLYHPYYHGEHGNDDNMIETQSLYMMPTNLRNSEQIMNQRIYRLMQRRHIHGTHETEHPHTFSNWRDFGDKTILQLLAGIQLHLPVSGHSSRYTGRSCYWRNKPIAY